MRLTLNVIDWIMLHHFYLTFQIHQQCASTITQFGGNNG